MQDRIETERLILRPFETSDAAAAFGWFGDPVVMRFTPTGPDKRIEDTEARLTLFTSEGARFQQMAHPTPRFGSCHR